MMKKVLLSLLTMVLLQGCVGGAFVVGAATGGVVVYDRRNFETIITDQQISHDASIRLGQDPEVNEQCHIVVASFNRLVLLVGQAPNNQLRRRALEIVKQSPKVKKIYNEIAIAAPTSSLTRSSDTWLTTKVKSEMLLTENLHSSQIKVVTENGTVYLMGLVTPKQAHDAAAVARHVAGVQRVVKIFEYVSVVN